MDINATTLSGRLTKDAELHKGEKTYLLTMTLAYSTFCYNPEKKQKEETPNYIRCKYWSKGADKIAPYMTKGAPLTISGELWQERWEDGDEHNRSEHVLIARQIKFFGGSKKTETAETAPKEVASEGEVEEISGTSDPDLPF